MEDILIHTCCGDCLLHLLTGEFSYKLTVFYSNSNIHPRSEYMLRLAEAKKAIQIYGVDSKLIIDDWRPAKWYESVLLNKSKELESESRCSKCIRYRLLRLCEVATSKGFKNISSAMLASEYMDNQSVVRWGRELAKSYNLNFIEPDSIDHELVTYGFYKQNYCGCIYSLVDRYTEKFVATERK